MINTPGSAHAPGFFWFKGTSLAGRIATLMAAERATAADLDGLRRHADLARVGTERGLDVDNRVNLSAPLPQRHRPQLVVDIVVVDRPRRKWLGVVELAQLIIGQREITGLDLETIAVERLVGRLDDHLLRLQRRLLLFNL